MRRSEEISVGRLLANGMRASVTWSIKMSLIKQRNRSLKMAISRSIAALMYQIIDVALSCVFDVTATLFSIGPSRRAIGGDLFPSPTRQNLPCSVSSAFNVFPSQHLSSHLSTSFRSMTLVSWAIREWSNISCVLCNHLYAKDNRMYSAAGVFRYQKGSDRRSIWNISNASEVKW